MSTENRGSTAKQNIALVQGDRARRYGQIVIIFILIAFTLGFVAWYAYAKADDNYLLYLATGLMGILFAGIGAAFSNMGLGRTVGSVSNNNGASREEIISIIKELQGPKSEEPTEEFFEDNQDDELETDQPLEVPIPRNPIASVGAIGVAPGQLQFLADRNTWRNGIKTINGKPVVLVAVQNSRRTKSKRTVYVYHVTGTNLIIYNRSRYGIFFMRIAHRPENMQAFFDTFVNPPLTDKEEQWLERNDYVLS